MRNGRFKYLESLSEEAIAKTVKFVKQRTGTGTETLTPNKLLTRLPMWTAQIRTRNISYKLRNEKY